MEISRPLTRVGNSGFVAGLEKASALPAWAAAPLSIASLSLIVAVLGLFWDVAYHIDHGRDANLFTAAHVMILLGLAGLGIATLASIGPATAMKAPTGWKIGPFHIPYATLPLGAMACASVIGFPLDDLWHRTYGIDVTLWSPTHLTMIGGGVLSSVALALYPAEARALNPSTPGKFWVRALRIVPILTALSVFLLEFDFGIPQFQALYDPLVLALGAGFALTVARAALGPGGAAGTAVIGLAVRAVLSIFVTSLGHTTPHFPLFVGAAAAVELGFWLTRTRPRMTGVVAGLLVGTLGIATEWAFNQVWSYQPWTVSMLPMMWAPVAMAVCAALLGLPAGRIINGQPPDTRWWMLAPALAGVALLLLLPLPRTSPSTPLQAHIVATKVGPARSTTDRLGNPASEQDVNVAITLSDAGAPTGADWFEVLAWQGGGEEVVPLTMIAPGQYRASGPIPTGASWKTVIFMAKGSEMIIAPISLPADPLSGYAGQTLKPVIDEPFVASQQVLISESHGGPPGVAIAAYAALFGLTAIWIGFLLYSYRAVARRRAASLAEA